MEHWAFLPNTTIHDDTRGQQRLVEIAGCFVDLVLSEYCCFPDCPRSNIFRFSKSHVLGKDIQAYFEKNDPFIQYQIEYLMIRIHPCLVEDYLFMKTFHESLNYGFEFSVDIVIPKYEEEVDTFTKKERTLWNLLLDWRSHFKKQTETYHIRKGAMCFNHNSYEMYKSGYIEKYILEINSPPWKPELLEKWNEGGVDMTRVFPKKPSRQFENDSEPFEEFLAELQNSSEEELQNSSEEELWNCEEELWNSSEEDQHDLGDTVTVSKKRPLSTGSYRNAVSRSEIHSFLGFPPRNSLFFWFSLLDLQLSVSLIEKPCKIYETLLKQCFGDKTDLIELSTEVYLCLERDIKMIQFVFDSEEVS
jgi:hypothetical protein